MRRARNYSRSDCGCSERGEKRSATKQQTLNSWPPVYKPGSVGQVILDIDLVPGRSFLSGCGRPHPLAAYPRRLVRGGPPLAAYLALLRLWFTLPPTLPWARWRSYPTFSPLPDPSIARGPSAVCFLWHCQSRDSVFPRPPVPRRYLAACPVEPGLSSIRRPKPPCRDRPTGGALRGKYNCGVRG